jgi:hypothetical protein
MFSPALSRCNTTEQLIGMKKPSLPVQTTLGRQQIMSRQLVGADQLYRDISKPLPANTGLYHQQILSYNPITLISRNIAYPSSHMKSPLRGGVDSDDGELGILRLGLAAKVHGRRHFAPQLSTPHWDVPPLRVRIHAPSP